MTCKRAIREQNQIVFFPTPATLKTSRILYTTHPDIRTKGAARESLSSLFGDSKDALWTGLIRSVDLLIDDLFHLANNEEPLPPRTDTREALTDPLFLAITRADYKKACQKRTAQNYQTHITLRVQLTLLLAIALQGRFPNIILGPNKKGDLDLETTEANIGTLTFYKQAAHHSIAPNLPLTPQKPVMKSFLAEIDLDKCAEELSVLPDFETPKSGSTSEPAVGRQLHILRELLASGVDFESLIEAYDKDTTSLDDARSEMDKLIEAKAADKCFNTHTLSFILQNFTYPAEAFLNNLDGSVEKCLRPDIFSGNFYRVITGTMDLATYSTHLCETIRKKVIDDACVALTNAGASYLMLRDKSIELRSALCVLVGLLQEAKIHTQAQAAGATTDDFPKIEEVGKVCKKLIELSAELDKLHKENSHLNTSISSAYFQPSQLGNIVTKIKTMAKGFLSQYKSRLNLADFGERMSIIQDTLDTLAAADEIASLPTFFSSLTRPIVKTSSVICHLNKMIDDLKDSVENIPTHQLIQEDLERMMADASSKLLASYEGLRSDQKHLFQHLLSAQLIPLIRTDITPESVPLVIRAPVVSLDTGDTEAATGTSPVITSPVVATPPVIITLPATDDSRALAPVDSSAGAGNGSSAVTPLRTASDILSAIIGGGDDDTD